MPDTPPGIPNDLTTVGSFWSDVEAHLAQNRLQEAGIPAFLLNELANDAFAGFGNTTGGIRVQVAVANVERARQLLRGPARRRAEPGEEEEESPADQAAARAWKMSLIGIIFLPVILHLVSGWILVSLGSDAQGLSEAGGRNVRRAWILNLIYIFGFLLLMAFFALLAVSG
jgi:hypothetical protein